ncbi:MULTISPECIES: DeoR/GlpR family DNA-binding transcription regulator [Anaerostipes]|uniref:DeoR/GlpR family DNA-binding transcription regulator n=1 Tax=Anaerostipes TaxID=207244 RepID=UPI00095280CD|nr:MULTISPECIES: DeoR/GlpR family DNA-binding transcription regulator [Anaerostipes]MCI5622160.1 DeoR/GlpR family DNA-binding transcription regulator [Anaerostipes sp.]MDY2726355.1 DeoR/GlpR family DNA-binding transcription regulator [Anaerostipes faecalis]OLR59664.1 DeoR family transcriptional regulator [Anaerostipes sp. 494a]
MGKLLAKERQNEIIEYINSTGSAKIGELAEKFDVTKETIRRDLTHLQEIGAIERSHGGATLVSSLIPVPIEARTDENRNLKLALCEKALELIPEKAVIYLDAGSTMQCMAQLLSQKTGYTIVTNSINTTYFLNNGNNVTILTGGQLNPNNMSTEGFQTTNLINSIKVDIAFLGTSGFEGHNGPAVTEFTDAQIKQSIIPQSKVVVVISDSSKAHVCSLVQYANWKDIDYFITDRNLPAETFKTLSELTEVILV